MKILIIGDIHSRRFWKKPLEENIDTVDKVIFLGDYCDPYQDEGVEYKWDDTISNFNEILEVKKKYNDKIVLLLGNHDCHYVSRYFDDLARSTRFDKLHCETLRKLFNDNLKLFSICHIVENNGKKVIFTHAGITKFWLDLCKIENDDNLETELNNLINSDKGFGDLAVVGNARTWFGQKTGSPLWCDISEFMYDKGLGENTFQIFGHTRFEKGTMVLKDGFACVDSQMAFMLDDENNLNKVK